MTRNRISSIFPNSHPSKVTPTEIVHPSCLPAPIHIGCAVLYSVLCCYYIYHPRKCSSVQHTKFLSLLHALSLFFHLLTSLPQLSLARSLYILLSLTLSHNRSISNRQKSADADHKVIIWPVFCLHFYFPLICRPRTSSYIHHNGQSYLLSLINKCSLLLKISTSLHSKIDGWMNEMMMLLKRADNFHTNVCVCVCVTPPKNLHFLFMRINKVEEKEGKI